VGNFVEFIKSNLMLRSRLKAAPKPRGGIGVFAGAVGLGSTGKTDKSQTAVNRIKFRVPVFYPQIPHP
jgi:hypothetical protein